MSTLKLSADGQQFFYGLAFAGAGVMAGSIGLPIATGLIELATNGGNLALAVAREKQDRCQKLLDGVVSSVEESYQAAWKQNRAQSARDEIEAAFAQLDAALVAIKPTPQEIVDAGFNGRKLYTALKAKLPASSLFQQSHAAEEVLSKIITGTYALIRSDQAFAAEFQNLGFERVLTVLDGMDGKLDDLLRGQLELKLQAAQKHEEHMAAIAERNGIPLENLEPVFQALEIELPQGSFETLIGVLTERIEVIKARGDNPVERLNDPVEVVAAIEAARAKLNQLDTEGALEGLRAARMEQAAARKARARGEARLAMEEAAILELGFRWNEALDVYAQAATLNPDNIWPHILSGDIRTHRGNLDSAESHFRDALAVAGRVGGDREQMIANGMRADNLIAQGNLDAAASHQAVMIEAAKRLAERDPSNSDWQRDLSVSHNKIGDVESARGNLEAALAAFKAGLAIRERLASQDASNSEWQRDLIVSNVKLAEYGDESVSRYKEALRITHDLFRTGRLAPVDHWMVEDLEKRLTQAST